MTTALLADPVSKEHNTGAGHPERPARWEAAVAGLGELALTPCPARSASIDELALCHTREYVAIVQADAGRGANTLSTGDTNICPASYDVALRAAGLCLHAVDLVPGGSARNAFCIVRTPGHHATPDRGMGFCVLTTWRCGPLCTA